MKKRILFIFRTPLPNIQGIFDGSVDAPAEFLWGMKDLDRTKYDIRFVNAPRYERRRGLRRLTWIFEVVFAKFTRIGLPLELYPMYRKEIRWADEIVCTYDQVSVGILFWRMFGFCKKKQIHAIVMSLSERIKYFRHIFPLRWLVSHMLRQADTILTLSNEASNALAKEYKLDRKKIHTWQFGIDTTFWFASKEYIDGEYILSIGNDMNRDFQTLVDALPADVHLKLISKKQVNIKNKHVTSLAGISDQEVRTLYQEAAIVVIPNKVLLNESSGLSCTLQAMACGKPVIISDAPPIRELFIDGEDCLFFSSEDANDLEKKIRNLLADAVLRRQLGTRAQQKVRAQYTSKHMSDGLMNILC